jgi:Protein of unknown function (DUF3604)
MRRLALLPVVVLVLACGGREREARIEGARKPDAVVATSAVGTSGKLVLFGDLHVHTSYSWDGALGSLPLIGGEGSHPPADACDYARYCSNLDFFALTDHAESMLPERWAEEKQSIRECNARAGDAANPDLVAFTGFEWSQAGLTPEQHWGHRCVIFPGTDDAELPARPIGALDRSTRWSNMARTLRRGRWLGPQHWESSTEYVEFMERLAASEHCPEGVDVHALPADCLEMAATPRELHEKLDQWGFPALTIPHGTTWGTYTPATTTIDKHLDPLQYDGERMRLVEIMSGHGNSEQYRSWHDFERGPDGAAVCPEPTSDFLPCCWQAGEIMRARCGDLPEDECERRVEEAKQAVMAAGTRPQRVFPDAPPEAWLDCDQCRDCFKPSYGYRPRESVQYAMTRSRPGADGAPLRFRYGFLASSDNHAARPGTGYKQTDPVRHSDVLGGFPFPLGWVFSRRPQLEDPRQPAHPRPDDAGVVGADQRVTSFLYPGGLVAVHAEGRSRSAIWDALERREVYGTSGPRILLWFDLLNAPGGPAPMGSEQRLAEAPRFVVRAVGSFEPAPGCPASSREALSAERLRRLCNGECANPSDRRRVIQAIEVIRIRPQLTPDEPADGLIEDPWRRFDCAPDPAGCSVSFDDREFVEAGRDALYYVRALEEPSLAQNGNPLEPERDAEGRTVATHLCTPERIDAGGCPAPVQERAWSSPIFVDLAPGTELEIPELP